MSTDATTAHWQVGVGEFDATPAPGRLWGRLRGLVLVGRHAGGVLALVAVDNARLPPGFAADVATQLGWPAEAVVVWSGGTPTVDVAVDAVVAAARRAHAAMVPGQLRVAVGPAWGLRTAPAESTLLVGQRLERSHRQLRSRAPDARLQELVERLSHGAPPPGTPWGHLLVDQRLVIVEATDTAGTCLGTVGWMAGDDVFEGGGWASSGLRGALARRVVAGVQTEPRAVGVVVGPPAPGRLGSSPRPANGPVDGRQRAERAADALWKVWQRLRETAMDVPPTAAWTCTRTVGLPPSDTSVEVGLTLLGSVGVLQLPGPLTDGLRLRLEAELELDGVLWTGPQGTDRPLFATPREAHRIDGDASSEDELGPWLLETAADLLASGQAVGEALPETPVAAEAPPEASPPEPAPPHLQATLRRGHRRGPGSRTVELAVRLRSDAVDAPGREAQIQLQWARTDGTWETARVQGLPVDDATMGMRVVAHTDRSGRRLEVRWTGPDLPRWAGRRFRVQVGAAYGGPFVSAPFKLK